ncbi:MAG: hypothetical protein ABIR70_10685 [Bryobacteraceae bacterium]
MTSLPSRVWGYDARVCGPELLQEIKKRDGAAHLQSLFLRPEIAVPCSTDKNIWPSVFDYYPDLWAHTGSERDPRLLDVAPGAECSGGFWVTKDLMRASIAASGRVVECITVEIFIPEDADVDTVPSPLVYAQPVPNELPAPESRLGYDVANAAGFSGMLDCGYTDEELAELRPAWVPRINDCGLLETLDDALEFLEITKRRTPEHGPFFVFGIYSDGEFGT